MQLRGNTNFRQASWFSKPASAFIRHQKPTPPLTWKSWVVFFFFCTTFMRTDCNVAKMTNDPVTLKVRSTKCALGDQLNLARAWLQLARKRYTMKQQDFILKTLSFMVSFQGLIQIAPVAFPEWPILWAANRLPSTKCPLACPGRIATKYRSKHTMLWEVCIETISSARHLWGFEFGLRQALQLIEARRPPESRRGDQESELKGKGYPEGCQKPGVITAS